MSSNVVWAKAAEGWSTSIAQIFGSGPKITIVCGKCGGAFKQRIPMVNYPIVSCPCGQANKLPLTVRR